MFEKHSIFIALLLFILTLSTCNSSEIVIAEKDSSLFNRSALLFSTTQALKRSFPLVEGYLDQSYGTAKNGTSFIPFSIAGSTTINDTCQAVALQSDGKMVVAGYTTNGTAAYIAVARYASTGQLDPSFGQSGNRAGTQYIPFSISGVSNNSSVCDQATAVAIQPDGKIVVAGFSTNTSTKKPCYCALARFTAAGKLDTSFGQSGPRAGTQYISFSISGIEAANTCDQSKALALQPDGKIIIAGFSTNVSKPPCYAAVARFTPSGQLDTTFGQRVSRKGTQYIPFSNSRVTSGASINDRITSLVLQTDGKIVVGGSTSNQAASTCAFMVARFNANGTLDRNFGQSGTYAGTNYVPFSIAGALLRNDQSLAVGIQSDGSIILGGTTQNLTLSFCALARFTSAGQLDTTFGQSGVRAGTTYIPFNIASQATTYDYITSLTVQSNDSIITAGFSSSTTNVSASSYSSFITTARFTAHGSLDQTFGKIGTAQVGTTFIPFGIGNATTKSDLAYTLGLESNGNIVVAGSTKTSSASCFCTARFINITPNTQARLIYGL